MSGLFFVARLVDAPSSVGCASAEWRRRAIEAGSERKLMPCALGGVIEPWVPLSALGEFLAEVSEDEVAAWNREGFSWLGYVRDFSAGLRLWPGEFVAGPWQTRTEALNGLEDIKEMVGVS